MGKTLLLIKMKKNLVNYQKRWDYMEGRNVRKDIATCSTNTERTKKALKLMSLMNSRKISL